MKALSLWQPWASLVACGAKAVETRGWRTSYRGALLVHAAKAMERGAIALCFDEPFRSALAAAGVTRPGDLPFGAIVAVCTLAECLPVERVLFGLSDRERAFGDYRPGRFAWRLENVWAIEPVPWRGAQGLFDVPGDAVEAAIVAAGRDL